jgi:predicted O-methyltransferase YrrM
MQVLFQHDVICEWDIAPKDGPTCIKLATFHAKYERRKRRLLGWIEDDSADLDLVFSNTNSSLLKTASPHSKQDHLLDISKISSLLGNRSHVRVIGNIEASLPYLRDQCVANFEAQRKLSQRTSRALMQAHRPEHRFHAITFTSNDQALRDCCGWLDVAVPAVSVSVSGPISSPLGAGTAAAPSFEGNNTYLLPNNWMRLVPIDEFRSRPISYLEIGTFFGANLLSVAVSYGAHPGSILHCIDPWEDYDEYPEYKGQQSSTYESFLRNVKASGHGHRVVVHRGFSNELIPSFDNSFFDIIYVDGNHQPEYALEDAVLSFRKLKVGGFMIFDDYGWGGPDLTKKGVDAFMSGYQERITILGTSGTQVFVRKKN